MGNGQSGFQNAGLEPGDVLIPDQFVIRVGNRVLPQLRLGNQRAETPRNRSHIPVSQLVPRPGERVSELLGILVESLRNRRVFRVRPQCEVCCEHHGSVLFRRIVGIRHGVRRRRIRGSPLRGTGRTLRLLPLVTEKVVEVVVVPLRRLGRPGTFQPAADRVAGLAAAKTVLPSEALLLDAGPFRFGTDVFVGISGAVGFAERVSTGNQRHCLLVVHRHSAERFTNVMCGSRGIRIPVGPLRIDIDQSHLDGSQWILEIPVAGVPFVSQPLAFRPPVNVLFRLPDILSPTGKTQCLEPHGFESTVAGEDHQIGPGDLAAILLLDRPQQPTGLVEVHIVGPTVQRRETDCAGTRTATAVGDAVRPRTVPRHPDEERAVVAIIGRPPFLRRRHHLLDVLLQGIEINTLELLGVVERLAHRIRQGGVLVKYLDLQLVRPPVTIGKGPSGRVSVGRVHHRALAFGIHIFSNRLRDILSTAEFDNNCPR